MKRLFVIFFFILSLALSGQESKSEYKVKLNLVDETTGEVVGFATVSISLKEENKDKPLKYTLSTDAGQATFEGLSKGIYVLKAEMLGYKGIMREIELSSNMDLGEIKLVPDTEMLNAAKVTSLGNPVEFKGDTVVYNASSFKTSDNDMLSDLLEKLPGVEIDENGEVLANGEPIKKILIDGEEFFLDDPQLATKNLPAKIVDKLNVIQRESEQARFTGVSDGNDETIIDLSLKPGIMGGWFGNTIAGAGHDVPQKGAYKSEQTGWAEGLRYQGAAMAGTFSDDYQLSVILNANNTNNRGFNDLSGAAMKSIKGGSSQVNTWGKMKGITNSWMGGLNGNVKFLDDALKVSGNYVYNGSTNNTDEESLKETFRQDGSSMFNDISSKDITSTSGHRFGFRLDYKFSPTTSIVFAPSFNFGKGSSSDASDFATGQETVQEEMIKKNSGYRHSVWGNDNWSTKGNFLIRHRFRKQSRTLSAVFNYAYSNNELWGFNQSLTQNYTTTGDFGSNKVINQRSDRYINRTSLTGRVAYTEPILPKLIMEASYSYGWVLSESLKDTYNSGSNNTYIDEVTGKELFIYDMEGEVRNDVYSNDVRNEFINQKVGANLKYYKGKLSTQIGLEMTPSNTINTTNGENYNKSVINWAPKAGIYYDSKKNLSIRGFYTGVTGNPNTTHLMPVPNNANPLNVSFGNPQLGTYFRHSLKTRFTYTKKKSFTSFALYLNGNLTESPIVRARWYGDNGGQYSIPVNGANIGSASTNIVLNTPLAKSNFSISSVTGASYNEGVSYIGTSKFDTDKYYDPKTEDFDYSIFNADFTENDGLFLNNRTQTLNVSQRLRFTYKSDLVHVMLGGRVRYTKSWYTIETGAANATWNNNLDLKMNWTLPADINIISNLDYQWYRGFETKIDDEFIFNLEFTKLINKKFTIALEAYDILNQSKNVSMRVTEDFRQEVQNNALGRYIIASLTYRFGEFGGGKK